VLCFELSRLYQYWSENNYPGKDVHFVAWGTGFVAAIFGLVVALHIGVMGKPFVDEKREWWSRTAALITIYVLAWTTLWALALYSPLIILWSKPWMVRTATLGWLVHTVYGALMARSARAAGDGPDTLSGILIKAAPPVFVVGLLALLSFCIYRAGLDKRPAEPDQTVMVKMNLDLRQDSGGQSSKVSAPVDSASGKSWPSFHDRATAYWPSVAAWPSKIERQKGVWTLLIAVACLGLAVILSWRVDVNEFSMHLLYRNRLERCYMGASHNPERSPNPFTGFDRDDQELLANFAQGAPPKAGKKEYVGPYPILNATLNVTHGNQLAWQERKAESFVFTPRYCGFDPQPDWEPCIKGDQKKHQVPRNAGYRPTRDYLYTRPPSSGGPYLGTAMAISGAALSPNMGYFSSPAVAFLMTVLDVRLGWWAGNPRHLTTWKTRGPKLGIGYLLLELFGVTNDNSRYVYLSDGGHFENLGIYELVRRRCHLILACDCSTDPEYTFHDLGNAIRKCRDDFGVDIEINVDNLRPREAPGQDREGATGNPSQHYAMGIINYHRVWKDAKAGILIYVKASVTGDEPSDVLEYKKSHPDFPHDSLADQWFSESQFESYRKLGQHIIEQWEAADRQQLWVTSPLAFLEMAKGTKVGSSDDLGRYPIGVL
jgi:hypothetical protein